MLTMEKVEAASPSQPGPSLPGRIDGEDRLSRRSFLKLAGLSLGSLACARKLPQAEPVSPPPQSPTPIQVRVTTRSVFIYSEPNLKSERLGVVKRDEILSPLEEISSPYGPKYNPRWYRVEQGYLHSSHMQRVEKAHLNEVSYSIPEAGQIGEITVPFSQSMRLTKAYGWTPLYRLYFQTIHWVMSVDEGPDKAPWYRLRDELLNVDYHVPAAHVRFVQPAELAPISPDVPPSDKRIEVSLARQELSAFEGERLVLLTHISSGVPNQNSENDIPTDTPRGNFHIQLKMPSKHMGGGKLTDDPEAYELVGVPWVSFFHPTGVAFHGTYWHDNFGLKMSHGCVNMRNDEALWLYRWCNPIATHQEWERKGYGTRIKIT